jgi:hypothetical protein
VRAPDSTVGDHYQRSGFSHDEVFLLGRTPDSRSIVAHEIGHAIMDDIYEDAYPATPNCSGHKVDTASSAGCAWTEGFADWLPLAVFDPVASEAHAQSTRGGRMTGRFETMVVIDHPIEEVFAFLADGENDQSSARGFWKSPRRRMGRRRSVPSTPARSRTPA